MDMNIVTGGGAGLMDAAREGHYTGDLSEKEHSKLKKGRKIFA